MFKDAYKITMKNEGVYSDHPHDRGGKTYKGISQKYHPEWLGWEFVDLNKWDSPKLEEKVQEFYLEKYWNSIKLDKINLIYSNVANELFDISVNFGTKKASTTFQRALNILNRDEKNFNDVIVDGNIGKNTFKVFDIYSKQNNEKLILKLIILLKAKFYIDIVEKRTSQEVFIRGWLNRIKIK